MRTPHRATRPAGSRAPLARPRGRPHQRPRLTVTHSKFSVTSQAGSRAPSDRMSMPNFTRQVTTPESRDRALRRLQRLTVGAAGRHSSRTSKAWRMRRSSHASGRRGTGRLGASEKRARCSSRSLAQSARPASSRSKPGPVPARLSRSAGVRSASPERCYSEAISGPGWR
jgi:hypothetical protein